MNNVIETLTFRRMIAPAVLQVLFWGAIAGTFYGSWVLYQLDNRAWPFPLIFGTLGARVIFEVVLLAFRIYDRLGEIRDLLKTREQQ